MATADYWSSADLKGIEFGGLINEDVMQQIWDISSIPLPFTDRMGSGSADNSYTEWTQDRLDPPNTSNASVDGQDAVGNDAKGGKRVGNQCQISTKQLQVTTRARESDSIGRGDELAYQVMMRQQECRRDVEAIMLTGQASQADDGDTTPGLSGGFNSWLETSTFRGAGGSDGGFSNGIVAAPTFGTARPLTETLVRDAAQAVYELGGMPSVFMARPVVVRLLSEYMFTSSARIATLDSDVGQNAGSKTAQGSVNVFVTDFGVTLEMVSNRLQQQDTGTQSSAYIYDPAMVDIAFLHGYRTEALAKTGLADKRQIAVDWTLRVFNEEAHAVIADIDETAPVTT